MIDFPYSSVEMHRYAHAFLHPFPPLLSIFSLIVHLPPENKAQCYQELVCTDEDKANVRELISAMGEKGYLSLLSDRTHMRLLGSQINHVHPLRFLSIVFCDPYLTRCLGIVMEDRLKRNGLLEGHSGSNGLGYSLTREADKEKLLPFLADFAKEIEMNVDEIRPFFERRDWEALVRFMIWRKTLSP